MVERENKIWKVAFTSPWTNDIMPHATKNTKLFLMCDGIIVQVPDLDGKCGGNGILPSKKQFPLSD